MRLTKGYILIWLQTVTFSARAVRENNEFFCSGYRSEKLRVVQSRKHEMCNTTQILFFSLIFSEHSSFSLIVTGVSIGVGALIAVVVGLVIL